MSVANKVLDIQVGSTVIYKNNAYQITHILGLDEVLLRAPQGDEILTAKLHELSIEHNTKLSNKLDLIGISDVDWDKAKKRYEIIKPLLALDKRSRGDVENRASEFDMHTNTVYQWLKRYESSGLLTSLLPQKRKDKGKKRLSEEVEAIIQSVIESDFLTTQRKSQQKVCDEVKRKCLVANIKPPHENTIRNRLNLISKEKVTAKRYGGNKASALYEPIKGEFPGADWPLSVIQIDHTKLDIILVDDIDRRPLGRPWITLAMDVCSRMVMGFYISFDPPSALSTGLCLSHGILPKEQWLAKYDVNGEWPCWGLPTKLHLDNAREFRGHMLQRACLEYGIDIEWRPVARPHFGAHVERLLGTFAKEIHTLPGTTFSSVHHKERYDSDKKATLSIYEFEQWLTTFIVDVYHMRIHNNIGMSPMAKYREGILGTDNVIGRGLPPKIMDEERLRLDFMPFVERTIQNYGVVIDEIHYYHDVLRKWINAPDEKKSKYKRKFMFRRDPRDLSVIWFYDPELSTYYPVPYRNTSLPVISVWELREAKRLANESRENVDEVAIFDAYERMKEIENKAKKVTSSTRRLSQRRKQASSEVLKPVPSVDRFFNLNNSAEPSSEELDALDIIQPFDELDDLQ